MKGLCVGLLCALVSASAGASQYIVKFKSQKGLNVLEKSAVLKTEVRDWIPQLSAAVVSKKAISSGALKALSNDIEYIESNDPVSIGIVEATSAYDEADNLWGMSSIKVKDAWKMSDGKGIVVAVSDTGIWSSHPDLKKNMWMNPGETGKDSNGKDKSKNKVDDDGNGYIDDVYGWDFIKKGPALLDNMYHGTHVAGTIAASMNKVGVVGAAPKAHLMASTFLNSQGSGTEAGGAQSIVYAAANGAKVINCSWGAEGESKLIADAVAFAESKGALVVAAAGNDGVDTDKTPHTPSSIPSDNVVSVGATQGPNNVRAWFSNYGATSVDLGAPGFEINSTFNPQYTYPRALYAKLSGTSMATPHVSGVVALIWSLKPTLSLREVKEILLKTVEPDKEWQGYSLSGGVLRADKALVEASRY